MRIYVEWPLQQILTTGTVIEPVITQVSLEMICYSGQSGRHKSQDLVAIHDSLLIL